jgi:hypothetical protein
MTFLQLINAVLTRLREDTIASLDETDYATLIGKYVNEAKQEVEDAWDWSHLRTYIDITTTASDNEYNLTGSNDRTRLMDAYNVTKKGPMFQNHSNVWQNYYGVLSSQEGSPTQFDVVGVDNTTGELKIRVYPTPSGTETLRFYAVVPQAELSVATTSLLVPSMPVIQFAYLRAINERGEDQGRLSEIQQALAISTLSDAVAVDANKFSDEITWRPI